MPWFPRGRGKRSTWGTRRREPPPRELITASFLDYAIPRADMMPPFHLSYRQTPSPHNLLGVKGVGECGSNGPPSAIGNALVDALWDLGVRHLDPPYTPFRVWRAIEAARDPDS